MHYLYILIHNNDKISRENALELYSYDNSDMFEFEDRTSTVKEMWAEWDKNEESKNHKYKSEEEFAKNWFGYTKTKKGEYGFYWNPKELFDWYAIGGRWNGFLNDKNEMNLKEFKKWLDSDKFSSPYGLIFNSSENEFVIQNIKEEEEYKENAREAFKYAIKDLDEKEDWCFTVVDLHN